MDVATMIDLLLNAENLHTILVVVIVVLCIVILALWRKINQLIEQLLEVRAIATGIHALNMQQSDELRTIKKQTNGGSIYDSDGKI